jgi:hypothetical protein
MSYLQFGQIQREERRVDKEIPISEDDILNVVGVKRVLHPTVVLS